MISIRNVHDARYPGPDDDFSPGGAYPEYRFGPRSERPNPAYAGVRQLFEQAQLDAAKFGTAEWNPLGEFVRPGARVFVLCNFVYQRRPQESELALQGKCIHGSVLRALIDYLLIAVGPEGRVTFGNSPLQSCRWERVLEDTEAARTLAFYQREGQPVEARDLRLLVAERDVLGRVNSVEHRDASADAREIDLGERSLLAELTGAARPNFRVADYDPRRTEDFHAGASHRYVINRAVLESDVIVSLSKLKTHEKVGITCGLKGFVGSVGHKDCLAHHRFGSGSLGGDEYPSSYGFLHTVSRFQDWLWQRPEGAPLQGPLQIADRTLRRALRALGVVQGGAWHGNDTCWRMALDLARILHYADASGVLHATPQRTHLSLIDGIVAGEGAGPLAPTPVRAGVLLFGDNVARVDRAASRLMGYDPARIPLIADAFREMEFSVADRGPEVEDVWYNGHTTPSDRLDPVLGRSFVAPPGWRGHI